MHADGGTPTGQHLFPCVEDAHGRRVRVDHDVDVGGHAAARAREHGGEQGAPAAGHRCLAPQPVQKVVPPARAPQDGQNADGDGLVVGQAAVASGGGPSPGR